MDEDLLRLEGLRTKLLNPDRRRIESNDRSSLIDVREIMEKHQELVGKDSYISYLGNALLSEYYDQRRLLTIDEINMVIDFIDKNIVERRALLKLSERNKNIIYTRILQYCRKNEVYEINISIGILVCRMIDHCLEEFKR